MSNRTKLLKRRPRTTTVSFCWDPDDTVELKRLRDAATDARRGAERPTAKAPDQRAADEAETVVDAFLASHPLVTFHLTAIGPKKAESIMSRHQPSKDQVKAHAEAQEAAGVPVPKRTVLPFDPDTYPPALVAKCCTRIVVTGEDGFEMTRDDPDEDQRIDATLLAEMFDGSGWATDDIGALFGTAQVLNQAGSAIDRDLVERLGNG